MTRHFGGRLSGAAKSRIGGLGLALLASTAFCVTVAAGPARAQQVAPATGYLIPAGPLAGAIARYGDVSNLQVLYPAALVRGKTSPGVAGSLGREEALNRLLAGTGLTWRFTGATTVTILDPAAAGASAGVQDGSTRLETIEVDGGKENAWGPVNGIIARNAASGTRTDTPIIETPQTVNVVGGEQMEQQGVSTVGEALRYTPGVVTGTAGGQADRHDSYFVRGEGGFSAAAQYASTLDGMRWRFSDRTSVQFDPWMLERVEVVKGPASALFGAGTPGGVVNLVSKRPSFEKKSRVFVSGGSYDSAATGVDFTGPLGDAFAYRFVGLGRMEGNGVDYQKGERVLLAPSLTFAPTEETSLTLSALYQRDPRAADAGFLPAYGSVLPIPGYGRAPTSFWQGDPDWNEYSRTESAIGMEFKHSFNENWKMTAKARYGRLQSTTKAMDYTAMVDPTTMMRTIYLAEHDNTSLTGDIFTEGRFNTGEAEHTLVLGVDHQRLTGGHEDGWDRFQYPTIDIFNPTRGVTPNAFDTFRIFEQPYRQTGVYAQDQVALGNWRFLGGLRYDKAEASSSTLVTLNGLSSKAASSDSALTGRIGAIYLFDNGLAPFISYSTSFNPQPSFKYDGSMLKPYTGEMLEAGLRYQSDDDTWFWSATAFTGEKEGVGAQATCTFPSAGSLDRCFTDATRATSKGVELEARAQLADGLDLIAAATWQQVRWKEYEGISLDRHVVGVPDLTASLWLNYTVPEDRTGYGWSFGAGIRYVGETYATDSNVWGATEYAYAGQPSKVPDFAVLDASIGYDFGALDKKYEGLQARVSAENLLDKHYVAACNGYGTCSYGKRRAVSFKLSYEW
ncbi:TonB-dependent siderophore receptor [Shinella sp.]|uniref:TonB-dependent siderophore receptor n=1 Tax=Shinella sp. TaxID=1870904 RepID=UPI0039E47C05